MRSGLRIIGRRGNQEVKTCLVRYAVWLRCHFEFPIRVPVYLHSKITITTVNGDDVAASFFAPFSAFEEPYIRVATGDYNELVTKYGRDDVLASYIVSLSHEIIHYQQWIETGNTWERGVPQKALAMLRRYEKTTDHP